MSNKADTLWTAQTRNQPARPEQHFPTLSKLDPLVAPRIQHATSTANVPLQAPKLTERGVHCRGNNIREQKSRGSIVTRLVSIAREYYSRDRKTNGLLSIILAREPATTAVVEHVLGVEAVC